MSAPLGSFENPRPYDILCGRNRKSFNNIGNRRFRITINMNVEKYDALCSRHERSKFIASLAHTMRYEVGFRFLKKKNGKNSETIDLTDDEVRSKVGHALRDLSKVLRETGGDEGSFADPEVRRSGLYKMQDMQFKPQDKKLEAAPVTPSRAPVPSFSSSRAKTPRTTVIQEESQKKAALDQLRSSIPQVVLSSNLAPRAEEITPQITAIREQSQKTAAPDQVRHSIFPVVQSSNVVSPRAEEITNLKSNPKKKVSKMFDQRHEHLTPFPLEVGQVFHQTLLNHPPQSLLPSYDDELDEFWTHEELQNERSQRSGRSQRSVMSIGTFDLHSHTEQSGRSQRTAMSVGSFDISFRSSCDAIETLSLVST